MRMSGSIENIRKWLYHNVIVKLLDLRIGCMNIKFGPRSVTLQVHKYNRILKTEISWDR